MITAAPGPTPVRLSEAPDLSAWLTKREAAQVLAVAEKTIERMAVRGELQQAQRKQPGRAPIVVYHPDDVGRAAQLKTAPLPAHVMMPAAPNLHISEALALPPAAGEPAPAALAHFAEALAAAIRAATAPATSPAVPLSEKLWLTLPEASAYSGLSVKYLEQQIRSGRLKVRKDRARKVKRVDLGRL